MVNQDILDEKMIKSLISSPDISVEVYDSIDSTNIELLRAKSNSVIKLKQSEML